MSPFHRRVFSNVKHWMKHHPVAANSILCLNLWVAGDILAQESEHKFLQDYEHLKNPSSSSSEKVGNHVVSATSGTTATNTTGHSSTESNNNNNNNNSTTIDWHRTVKCASYGGFVIGPLLAVWYPFLDRTLKSPNLMFKQRYGLWAIPICKVLADEFVAEPPLLVAFYSYMNVFEGGTMETLKQKLEQEFFPSWGVSLLAWPPVLLGTFRFLPVYAHAPVINAFCILWDGFLSHRNAVAARKELEQQQQQQWEQPMPDNVAAAVVKDEVYANNYTTTTTPTTPSRSIHKFAI